MLLVVVGGLAPIMQNKCIVFFFSIGQTTLKMWPPNVESNFAYLAERGKCHYFSPDMGRGRSCPTKEVFTDKFFNSVYSQT